MQRQLREAVDRLRDKDLRWQFVEASRNVEPEVEEKLNRYLCGARWNLYEEFNRKVIEEATRLMEKDGCFGTLAIAATSWNSPRRRPPHDAPPVGRDDRRGLSRSLDENEDEHALSEEEGQA